MGKKLTDYDEIALSAVRTHSPSIGVEKKFHRLYDFQENIYSFQQKERVWSTASVLTVTRSAKFVTLCSFDEAMKLSSFAMKF